MRGHIFAARSSVLISLVSTIGAFVIGGCISSDEEKMDPSIQGVKIESKLYFSVDSLFPDSSINVNYSLSIHNMVLNDRYKVELEFHSQSNQFIQGYSIESYANDTTSLFRWTFPRRASEQVNRKILAYLRINNAQFAEDTATYVK